MKLKKFAAVTGICLMTFIPMFTQASVPKGIDNKVEWSTTTSWKLPAKPLSFVHSLDGKRVYVLTDNHKVNVFTPQGELLGSIPVSKGVSDIDIAPYGEQLFLVDSEKNTFTKLSVSLVSSISIGSSPFKGPENAPIAIVLFTDFE